MDAPTRRPTLRKYILVTSLKIPQGHHTFCSKTSFYASLILCISPTPQISHLKLHSRLSNILLSLLPFFLLPILLTLQHYCNKIHSWSGADHPTKTKQTKYTTLRQNFSMSLSSYPSCPMRPFCILLSRPLRSFFPFFCYPTIFIKLIILLYFVLSVLFFGLRLNLCSSQVAILNFLPILKLPMP